MAHTMCSCWICSNYPYSAMSRLSNHHLETGVIFCPLVKVNKHNPGVGKQTYLSDAQYDYKRAQKNTNYNKDNKRQKTEYKVIELQSFHRYSQKWWLGAILSLKSFIESLKYSVHSLSLNNPHEMSAVYPDQLITGLFRPCHTLHIVMLCFYSTSIYTQYYDDKAISIQTL